MGQLDEFELKLEQIQDFPVVYRAEIPEGSQCFQDVRRYQHDSSHLKIQLIDVDGRITPNPDMVRVPMSKLTAAEKKEFIAYLKKGLSRGDNMGANWGFFKSAPKGSNTKKSYAAGYGGNILHEDPQTGRKRAAQLLSTLEKDRRGKLLALGGLKHLILLIILIAGGLLVYRYGYLEKSSFLSRLNFWSDSSTAQFYKKIFPDISSWANHKDMEYRQIASELLRPEYIEDMQTGLSQNFYQDPVQSENPLADRLLLFIYFNYNTQVKKIIKTHESKLKGTEFMRLAKIYSCELSRYSSNIFYFKVGDLNIPPAAVNDYVSNNLISLDDFTKLRDKDQFSDLLKKDDIGFQMKRFLEDVYTFSPLRVKASSFDLVSWYLVTQKNTDGELQFSAFFAKDKATLIPRNMAEIFLHHPNENSITWYPVGEDAAQALHLTPKALRYFSRAAGQGLQLDAIARKIDSLELTAAKESLQVSLHRELLMEDDKGKYAISCNDPITSLVLSNLITTSSFEKEKGLPLKRDPIQMNTTLVQLSRDDSLSSQTITITPGKTGIVRLFERTDSFSAISADGTKVVFEKPEKNLFSAFPFTVVNDSINFGGTRELSGMTMNLKGKKLKIIQSMDGNYRIEEIQ